MTSTHRIIQLSELADKASSARVAYHCRAIKAANLGNHSLAAYFTNRANRFEQIRIHAARAIVLSRPAPAQDSKP